VNVTRVRGEPRKRLRNGTGLTKEVGKSFLCGKRDDEESDGGHKGTEQEIYSISFLHVR